MLCLSGFVLYNSEQNRKHQQNPFNGNEIICEKVDIKHYEKYVTGLS